MITIVDETIILRYLLNDEKRQSAEAARIIGQGDAYTSHAWWWSCATCTTCPVP